ncbi:protein mono-ADP-ribosyltransferase PARP9 isoform X2 [Chaetodon auriga]
MFSKMDIPLHGPSVNIVRRCGPALSDILQCKYGCVATISGVDFEGDPSCAQQKRPPVTPEKRFAVTLAAGVRVSVWKADLTNFRVDAVVNAANEHLQHYGGLALALSFAGGPQIQKESEDYIKKYGVLKTGQAVVLDAGSLPCSKIIHAVGPELSKHPSKADVTSAEKLLKQAISSILDKVKEHHLKTVAIPAISSGLFNYPLPQCAATIVTAVKRYYEYSSGPRPEEILLVNNDEPTVREMERACHHILGRHSSMTYSQAAASRRGGDGKTSTSTVQMGNVRLTLKTGCIEEQQTDVIVNTTMGRSLENGQISKALLQKAGYGMQNEMYDARKRGHIIITKAYKLQCQEVYHTCVTDIGNDTAQQVLFESVVDCLRLASEKHYKSIAFPAIGTGGLGFDKNQAAWIMSNAVDAFAQKATRKLEVYFVIFPADTIIFKAFEEQMRNLQKKASPHSLPHASEQRDDFPGSGAPSPPSPQISLSSSSDAATREAERWLQGLLFESFGTVILRNNFIQHFGEQEHLQLSRLMKKGVSIEELFERGHASVTVHGDSREDVVVAGLQVEALLCNVQREFVREEECAIFQMLSQNVSFERKTVDYSSLEFADRQAAFKQTGLRIVKVDKVENAALKTLFDLKKSQLGCFTAQTMFQCIQAQFCDMVSHIGFHAQYAPPDDPAYGEGIYFASSVKKALKVWKEQDKEYLHFAEAEVLTGTSTLGKPGLILPPALGTEPHRVYDSLSGPDISVIFSGYQALPTYIITCKIY